MTINVRTLFTSQTATQLFALGIELAAALGLNTTSWRVGDAERTLMQFLANVLAHRDLAAAEFTKGGYLSQAMGSWLTLRAKDTYGVERAEGTYATPSVTLANGGGAVYSRAAGEVIVKASSTGITFRSTEDLALASGPGTSATIELVADVVGSEGNVGVDDIDEIVTTMLGVTISSSTAATGINEQADAALVTECLATLGSLSVNGPPDAYNAVALDADLTGTVEVTRSVTSGDSATGELTVWIAGSSGAVSSGARDLVELAVEKWATPATVTPTVVSAANDAQAIVYEVSADDIPATAEADIDTLARAYVAAIAIGGHVSLSALSSIAYVCLHDGGASSIEIEVTSPDGGDLAAGYVATVSSVVVTEV